MPNKQLYMAPSATYTVTNTKTGVVSRTACADFHSLFETYGYVGPRLKISPPPIHAYNFYRDRIVCTRDYLRSYVDGKVIFANGNCMGTTPHSVVFTPPISYANSYARALDKLNDIVRGDLNLSVDFAQASQVHRMLKLQDRAVDYTKLFFKRRFGTLRAMANARLEYMYGIKPLMSSIFGAADESLRRVFTTTKKFRVRGTDPGYKADTVTLNLYYGSESFKAHNVGMKVSTTLGLSMVQHDHDIARFMSMNPLGIAWELVPYSFVVDWFLDIGGYLQNMETYLLYNNDFLGGYRSDLAAFSGSVRNYDKITTYPPGDDKRMGEISGLRFNRSILSQYPIPGKPKFKVDLGSSRLLNGAALLAQFLGAKGVVDPGSAAKAQSARDKEIYRERVNRSRNIHYRNIVRM